MNKIAFIKFGGMANGGTEKVLQTIASHLPKDKFQVDFYYCDAAPYIGSDFKHIDTDQNRLDYVKSHGVNLIKFKVGAKNVTTHTHDWVDTDFWDLFNEEDYDVIQTGRAGHPEYPFVHINKTPIVDGIHLAGMAENKSNSVKTILISEEQKSKWISAGGPADRAVIIPVPVIIPDFDETSYKEEFGWSNKFVFGMHQRNDDGIFSPVPIQSYKDIETEQTAFLMLGGSRKYEEQAKALGVKNIKFLETTSDVKEIHKFLNTLDVYSHGRIDGEQCSSAIIEALSHSLPVVSHNAPSMGQKEQIGDAGVVASSLPIYSRALYDLMNDKKYHKKCRQNAERRYNEIYDVDAIITRYTELYEEICNG